MSVCEILGLTRDYGKGRGVFDLSFSINQGEVFGFLGPNGAGKTTTIRHLMGFLKPEKGYCTIGSTVTRAAATVLQAGKLRLSRICMVAPSPLIGGTLQSSCLYE